MRGAWSRGEYFSKCNKSRFRYIICGQFHDEIYMKEKGMGNPLHEIMGYRSTLFT